MSACLCGCVVHTVAAHGFHPVRKLAVAVLCLTWSEQQDVMSQVYGVNLDTWGGVAFKIMLWCVIDNYSHVLA